MFSTWFFTSVITTIVCVYLYAWVRKQGYFATLFYLASVGVFTFICAILLGMEFDSIKEPMVSQIAFYNTIHTAFIFCFIAFSVSLTDGRYVERRCQEVGVDCSVGW